MTTLYDVLGALPNDNADELRTAFRKAVKSTHPDLRPGDPDAALKFRQILRANDILSDLEQRATYDHLLALAGEERHQDARRAFAAKLRQLAAVVMAFAGASVVTAGAYLLAMHMPANAVTEFMSIASTGSAPPSTVSVPPVTIAPLKPISVATTAVKTNPSPPKPSDAIASAIPEAAPVSGQTDQSQSEPVLLLASAAGPPSDKQPQLLVKIEDRPSELDRMPCVLGSDGNDCATEITGAVPSPALNDPLLP